jgi:hypothetical protein
MGKSLSIFGLRYGQALIMSDCAAFSKGKRTIWNNRMVGNLEQTQF